MDEQIEDDESFKQTARNIDDDHTEAADTAMSRYRSDKDEDEHINVEAAEMVMLEHKSDKLEGEYDISSTAARDDSQ